MITTNYTSEKWQAFAQCAASSVNKDIFFSEEIHEIAAAKQVCASCEGNLTLSARSFREK